MVLASNAAAVEIVEVAPRDGFQSILEPLLTETKIDVIEALLKAGYRRMEIGSFVSPRAVPQMLDMADIAAHFKGRTGLRLATLVPNRKGAELALKHGISNLVFVFSVSESHNLANVKKSVTQSLEELEGIESTVRGLTDVELRVDLATAFDCPYDGDVPLDAVRQAVERVLRITPDAEIALCDTTGRADPHRVRDAFAKMIAEFGLSTRWAFHGHDTFGLGVANALFAHQAGVRVFDGAAAGLGGCPFAPGATGNTASEDLLFAFEQSGIQAGLYLERLLVAADRIADLPGACVGGHLRTVPRRRALSAGVASTGKVQ
jgi:hydroxymethylglutaryl-CoA lyase